MDSVDKMEYNMSSTKKGVPMSENETVIDSAVPPGDKPEDSKPPPKVRPKPDIPRHFWPIPEKETGPSVNLPRRAQPATT